MFKQQTETILTPKRNNRMVQALKKSLQLDREYPAHDEATIAAEVAHNYRWNFVVNILDNAAFKFGVSLTSASTILPLFISKLTSNPLLPVGIIGVIAQGGWFLPQVFAARVAERLPQQKPVVIKIGLFAERLPYWVIAVSPLVALHNPTLAIILLLLGYTWHTLGSGSMATFWQEMIARSFSTQQRGRFFGIMNFLGGFCGALGAGLSASLLEGIPFPTNFFYIFLIAAISLMISWYFVSLNREPIYPVTAPHQTQQAFFKKLPQILRADRNFRQFLIARLLLGFSGMGSSFLTVAALERWQISDSTVGIYTTAMLVGETAAHLIFGFMADRFGHKRSLTIGALITALSYFITWLAPTPNWQFLVFFFQGASLGAVITAGIMIIMEFGTPQQRPTYIGLANTSVGIIAMAAPLLGALLANISYNILFAVSGSISFTSFALLWLWVKEPRGTHALTPQGNRISTN